MKTRLKAPSLICLLTLSTQILAPAIAPGWAPQAHAETHADQRGDAPAAISRPTYTFSMDVPERGALDMYHNSFTLRDKVSDALYVLRNTAIEDLLNTRKGIKALLGGTAGLARIAKLHPAVDAKRATFDLPPALIDLYLLGMMPNQVGSGETIPTGAVLPGPVQTHGVDREARPAIPSALHWLMEQEPVYDPALRRQLLLGLAYVSALITQYDQQAKFIDKDFLDSPGIATEFYEQEIMPEMRMHAGSGVGIGALAAYGGVSERNRAAWMAKHGMTDILAAIVGQREFLLDRYHLLSLEIDGTPLYKLLYAKLQTIGFPAANFVQKPLQAHLPQGAEPIQMPDEFERAVQAALEPLAKPEAQGGRQDAYFAQLAPGMDPLIDGALMQSLAVNSERLETLTSEIDYSGDRSSPLLELARFEDLWSASYAKYGYLEGIIDFAQAHQELSAYQGRVDTTHRHIRYGVYGAGIGIGIVATIFSAGAALEAAPVVAEGAVVATRAATLMGIPLRAWLIGSGLLTSAQAISDYVDSRRAAEVAQNLYLGTVHTGTHQQMAGAVLMAHEDYKMMLGSLIMLGAEAKALTLLSSGRTLIGAGGKVLVQVGTEEIAALRKIVAALAERAQTLAPLGRALIATLRQILGMTVGIDRVMALEEAIPLVAQQLRMTAPAVRAKLEENVMIGSLIKGYRARILAKPTFLKTMLEQQVGQAVVGMITEYTSRGDKFNEQLGDVAVDMIGGTVWTAALVWIDVPTAAIASEASAANRVRIQAGMGQKALDFGKAFVDRGKKNFIVGFASNGAIRAGAEGWDAWKKRKDPNAPEASERALKVGKDALFGGTFLAVSSDLRYQGYKWIGDNIGRVIKQPGEAKIVLDSINLANNYFGGWHYIKLAKLAGIQADGSATPAGGTSGGTATVQSLGNAFFRVDSDEAAANYAFDFLRQGEAAGPAPSVQ